MAETTEVLVPVPMGTLTESDYERLIDAAMPSLTEVAPVEIAVAPEKPAVVVETKPRRICAKCGHADGNSVGRIKRGRIDKRWDPAKKMLVHFIDWFCQPCLDKEPELPEAERDSRPVLVAGELFAEVNDLNGLQKSFMDARAEWLEIAEGGMSFNLDAVKPNGICEHRNCHRRFQGDLAVVHGKIRKICKFHSSALREVKRDGGAEKFATFYGPDAPARCQRHLAWLEIFERKAAAAKVVVTEQAAAETTPVVTEPARFFPALPPPKPKLSRAERERRRNERRARLAAELQRDKDEAAKRGVRYEFSDDSNRYKGKSGKDKRRH